MLWATADFVYGFMSDIWLQPRITVRSPCPCIRYFKQARKPIISCVFLHRTHSGLVCTCIFLWVQVPRSPADFVDAVGYYSGTMTICLVSLQAWLQNALLPRQDQEFIDRCIDDMIKRSHCRTCSTRDCAFTWDAGMFFSWCVELEYADSPLLNQVEPLFLSQHHMLSLGHYLALWAQSWIWKSHTHESFEPESRNSEFTPAILGISRNFPGYLTNVEKFKSTFLGNGLEKAFERQGVTQGDKYEDLQAKCLKTLGQILKYVAEG